MVRQETFAFILGGILKQSINLGANGWRHKHWLSSFYPEDLPVDDEDWRLAYYSNEFSAVLVPVDYWQSESVNECEDWLDSVHSEFRFFVECHAGMFERILLADLTTALKILAPQLSALIFLDENPLISDDVKGQFLTLADSLGIEVVGLAADSAMPAQVKKPWRPDGQAGGAEDLSGFSNFAFFEDDLSDLRSARIMVEQFVSAVSDDVVDTEATIIVNHPRLQADNLSKFRSVLDIMGH